MSPLPIFMLLLLQSSAKWYYQVFQSNLTQGGGINFPKRPRKKLGLLWRAAALAPCHRLPPLATTMGQTGTDKGIVGVCRLYIAQACSKVGFFFLMALLPS